MRRRAVLGAVAVVAGLLAVPSASAAPPERTAWWSAASAPGLSLPQPSTAEGDLRISRGTDVLAFAGVLYRAAGSTSATLSLPVREGRTTGTPDVVACPTVDLAWEEGGNQPRDKAPAYDCTLGMAFGLLSPDGKTLDIGLDATQQLEPGVWSLALVPNPEASAPFAIELQAPPDDAFTADPPAESSPPAGGEAFAAAEPAPEAGESASVDIPFSPTVDLPADTGGEGAAFSPLLADAVPLDDVVAGAEGEAPLVATEEPAAGALPTRAVAATEEPGAGLPRVLALLVLIVVCAAVGHAAGQQRLGPRLLGGRARALAAASPAGPTGPAASAASAAAPFAAATGAAAPGPPLGRHERPRGIGRFARTREAPPRGLR